MNLNTIDPTPFRGPGCQYPPEINGYSYTDIRIAQEMTGKQVDDTLFMYLSCFRPSYIRIIPYNGTVHLDGRPWRITVYLDKDKKIKSIYQEVRVDLTEFILDGAAFNALVTFGPDDERFKWENSPCECVSYGIGGTYRTTKDGKKIPYPDVK